MKIVRGPNYAPNGSNHRLAGYQNTPLAPSTGGSAAEMWRNVNNLPDVPWAALLIRNGGATYYGVYRGSSKGQLYYLRVTTAHVTDSKNKPYAGMAYAQRP